MAKRFITAALPYVNNQPHLGNIVGSVLGADVYNRYCKMSGDDTAFICGTDEYGTATEMEAVKKKVHPRVIVETNRIIHKSVYDWMEVEFDIFGNTSCEEHSKVVKEVFYKCYENGYFEKQEVEQFFCEECKQYLADRFVEGTCALCGYEEARGDQCDKCGKCLKVSELKAPRCSLCSSSPVMKRTNHLFLRLDLLQNSIKESMDPRIGQWTENAKNIYKDWLGKDLISRCMTRTLRYKWGVQVPLEGFEDKVFYVWFDAVIGYYTFLSIFKKDWQEWIEDANIIQFMGKDNVFFHAFIFPGIMLASGNDDCLVNVINSTEYLTFNGNKFSKSRNVGIFGMDLISKDLGSPCMWRYYLIRKRPETKDSDFSMKEFVDLYNADLRSNLGNLCQRVLKYISARCNGIVKVENTDDEDECFVREVKGLFEEYKNLMSGINLREGVAKALEISSKANKYIQGLQNSKHKMSAGFNLCYSAIVLLGYVFYPFIPKTSAKIFRMCNVTSFNIPGDFEIINSAKISDDIQILFSPLTDLQNSNLSAYME